MKFSFKSPRALLGIGCIAFLLGRVNPASAEGVLIGGVGGSEINQIGYLGWVAPLPGQRLGDGWAYSVFVDYLRYRYSAGNARVQAEAPGAQIGVLREFTLPQLGVASLGVVATSRNTELSPNDPGNSNEGFKINPGAQAQWRSDDRVPLATALFANYVFGRESYYVKGFAGLRTGGGWAIGPEATVQGDPTYRIVGTSLGLRDIAFGQLRIGFRAGIEFQSGGRQFAAGGAEFSYYIP